MYTPSERLLGDPQVVVDIGVFTENEARLMIPAAQRPELRDTILRVYISRLTNIALKRLLERNDFKQPHSTDDNGLFIFSPAPIPIVPKPWVININAYSNVGDNLSQTNVRRLDLQPYPENPNQDQDGIEIDIFNTGEGVVLTNTNEFGNNWRISSNSVTEAAFMLEALYDTFKN